MDETNATTQAPKRGPGRPRREDAGTPGNTTLTRVPRDLLERVKEMLGADTSVTAVRALLFAVDKAGPDGKLKIADVREALSAARQMVGANT